MNWIMHKSDSLLEQFTFKNDFKAILKSYFHF